MRTIKFFTLAVLFISILSCSDDNDDAPFLVIESETISNLHAPQSGGQGSGEDISGAFTKFSFSTGQATTSETEWDIAFRGTSIILNGGTSLGTTDEPDRTGEASGYIADSTLGGITKVNTALLKEDSDKGYVITGWYTYSGPPKHVITPTPGKVLVIKTHDGKYAKVEILSYYKDAPENPDGLTDESRYFTFKYVYQPNEGITTF
ncbi:HmuY family protein [Confluentibacter sediminis]|uniref:HmuY family protein n=1 Tax=Confluentibacter sediminis TaxID=2219045 RepID=UPI000DABD59B|nr:HmuY family protein [Confluentibacter sediminis]